MESLGFSPFRSLMDQWDESRESIEIMQKVGEFLDGHGICFLFIKDGGLFGGPEDSRMAFARMKNPDPEELDFEDDFTAFPLDDITDAAPSVLRMFGINDLDGIEVIDRDRAIDHITKNKKKKKSNKKAKK